MEFPERLLSHGFPVEARDVFAELLAHPLMDEAVLLERVVDHVEEARQAIRHNEFLDLELARQVASACRELLVMVERRPGEEPRRLVQASCRYFVQTGDADDDFQSLLGFEDDARVVSAVARYLGRDDLVIEIG